MKSKIAEIYQCLAIIPAPICAKQYRLVQCKSMAYEKVCVTKVVLKKHAIIG